MDYLGRILHIALDKSEKDGTNYRFEFKNAISISNEF